MIPWNRTGLPETQSGASTGYQVLRETVISRIVQNSRILATYVLVALFIPILAPDVGPSRRNRRWPDAKGPTSEGM